jgi:hypothetical protein
MNPQESIEVVRQTVEDLRDEGYSAEIDEYYCGRGMHGEGCYAIYTAERCDEAIIAAAAKLGLRGARVDSLGRGVIVYWPHVKSLKEEESV